LTPHSEFRRDLSRIPGSVGPSPAFPAWSPDGRWLAAAFGGEAICIWREDGALAASIPGRLAMWSPDDRQLAAAHVSRVTLWQVETWEELANWDDTALGPVITALAWSMDGQIIAMGDEGGSIRIRGLSNGRRDLLSPFADFAPALLGDSPLQENLIQNDARTSTSHGCNALGTNLLRASDKLGQQLPVHLR
jgi:hypothetical protein